MSDNADTICDYIHKELNHSATIMSAEGSYSHEPKESHHDCCEQRSGIKTAEIRKKRRTTRIYDDHKQ